MTEQSFDPAYLKEHGINLQVDKTHYAIKLRVVAGDIAADYLQTIAALAEKYGDRRVHITTRQGLELHGIVPENLAPLLAEMDQAGISPGSCGPRVRVIMACPGNVACPFGIIETKSIAGYLDEKYFRRLMPYKFKLAVTGCPNNCAKATDNDLGIMGGIKPAWRTENCVGCNLCVKACPKHAISAAADEYWIDERQCINCSACTAACPKQAMVPGAKGYTIWIGGTMGKNPRIATKLCTAIESLEETYRIADKAIEYYRQNGRPRERFGQLLDRIGVDQVCAEILSAAGD
jgi:dissimilatory sulfite reductase (desulfoviridin) alpha/beta subunit